MTDHPDPPDVDGAPMEGPGAPEEERPHLPLVYPREPETLVHRVIETTRRSIRRTFRGILHPRLRHSRSRHAWRSTAGAASRPPTGPGRRGAAPAKGASAEMPGGRPPGEARVVEQDRSGAEAPVPLPGASLRGTLQFLPGRLVPLGETRLPHEIRFVRLPGVEHSVTLGSARGDPARHVTLDHPSVSAHHARLRYRDRTWSVESLSEDAPTWVNGTRLASGGEGRSLEDGDRVRVGELEYEFHQPQPFRQGEPGE